jgi:hypothetical protein
VDVAAWSRADHYAVVRKVAESSQMDGPKVGRLFLGNLGSLFWGMFLIFGFSDFIEFIDFLINVIKTYYIKI